MPPVVLLQMVTPGGFFIVTKPRQEKLNNEVNLWQEDVKCICFIYYSFTNSFRADDKIKRKRAFLRMILTTTANINGRNVEYVRYGRWTKVCILFFHGHAGSARYIPDEEYNHRGNDYCILSFNRPGVGNSESRGLYKIEEFVSDIRDFLVIKGIENVVLVGHSAGGLYAQVFASLFPEITSGLILVSSLPNLNNKDTRAIISKSLNKRRLLLTHLPSISKFYFKGYSMSVLYHVDQIINEKLKEFSEEEREYCLEHIDLYREAVIKALTNSGKGAYFDAKAMFDKREEPKLDSSIKVFIWSGEQDRSTPPEYARYLSDLYNPVSFHLLPDLGHMLYLVRWKDMLDEAFLYTGL